jgi:pimeloyl-ACP methyl ester carboxylesterase
MGLAVFLLIGCGSVLAQSGAKPQVDPTVARLGKSFVSNNAKLNGTTLHYVRGGTGPAVILLQGFPQDWYEFHRIMPRLSAKFTVVAVDLCGMGGSAAIPGGYDAANVAEDVHQPAEQLHLGQVYVVGHDIGGMVAYACARRYPEAARGVMILDVPLPGIGPWGEIQTLPQVCHIRFHQTPELPEKLIAERQAICLRHFLRGPNFSDADVACAFPAEAKFKAAQLSRTNLPLLLAAGGSSPFNRYVPRIAQGLREHGCANVKTEVIKGSAHYVAHEQPATVAELVGP